MRRGQRPEIRDRRPIHHHCHEIVGCQVSISNCTLKKEEAEGRGVSRFTNYNRYQVAISALDLLTSRRGHINFQKMGRGFLVFWWIAMSEILWIAFIKSNLLQYMWFAFSYIKISFAERERERLQAAAELFQGKYWHSRLPSKLCTCLQTTQTTRPK